ncbi:unnamed protein product [Prorocentrum cordatum]|uniref:Uncharacterized protein n=1 Tax=Prorocentrum cordatum TaxID=2364126 RepID=A0ABN9PJ96_9DINO|nr:unnamed protein product [Polarella glacialis]
MEVKQNLCAEDRKANLKRFSSTKFKKVARVAVGVPPKEYVDKVHRVMLEQKQRRLEAEWKARKEAKERKKQLEQRRKQILETKRKEEEEKSKETEEVLVAAKAAEEAKKDEDKAQGGEKTEETAKEPKEEQEDPKADEAMEVKEEAKEEPKEQVKEESKEEDEEEPDEPMPVAELTDEERARCFHRNPVADLAPGVLSSSFCSFTLPDKSEGFDEIVFEWQPEAASRKYLKDYVLKNKVTSRIDDLQPGEWFKTAHAEFEKLAAQCQEKAKLEDKDDKPLPADVHGVEDINDTGDGRPLFKLFGLEDWALLALRCEFYLLASGYQKDSGKDTGDPERPGIHHSHVAFYSRASTSRKAFCPNSMGRRRSWSSWPW